MEPAEVQRDHQALTAGRRFGSRHNSGDGHELPHLKASRALCLNEYWQPEDLLALIPELSA